MDFSNLRVIEKLYAEREEIERSREEERRLREEAVSRVAKLEQSREEAARNILKAGQPVEQVARWIGLPLETVQILAAQL